jgi:hypothetical protein
MNTRRTLATLCLLALAAPPARAGDSKIPLWSGTPVTMWS